MKYGEAVKCVFTRPVLVFMARPAGTPWINLLPWQSSVGGQNQLWVKSPMGPMYVLSYIESLYACYNYMIYQTNAYMHYMHCEKGNMLWNDACFQPLVGHRFLGQDSNALQEQLDQIHENLGCLETSNITGKALVFMMVLQWLMIFFNLMENDSWCFMFKKNMKELSDAFIKARFW